MAAYAEECFLTLIQLYWNDLDWLKIVALKKHDFAYNINKCDTTYNGLYL
jgi:hypothetical protein